MRRDVRDKRNTIIGHVMDDGNQIRAFHLRTGYLGMYIKSMDMTVDIHSSIFCRGDGTTALILAEEARYSQG